MTIGLVRPERPARGARSATDESERLAPFRVVSPVSLSIVVPAYNEERTIDAVLDDLLAVDYGCDFEIIVVDDGSTDRTTELLAHRDGPHIRTHRHQVNLGKGAALRTGAALACGTHMVPFDADREYDAQDLVGLMKPIIAGRTDVVFGTRIFGNHTVYQSFRYALGNRALTFTANLIFDAYISDLHTCLKVVPVPLFRELSLRQFGFGLDTELAASLLKRGIRPFEIPISYHSRTRAEGKKITWRHGVECLAVLAAVRMRRAAAVLPEKAVSAVEAMAETLPERAAAAVDAVAQAITSNGPDDDEFKLPESQPRPA